VKDRLYPGWTTPADAFTEWRRISAGRLCDYSGITYERIDACGGVQWPAPADDHSVPVAGTARLYADGAFPNPTGRVRLPVVERQALREPPRPDFPFVLNTGRTVEHWHTRTKTGRVTVLEGLAPEAWVEINPSDAEALRIRTGDVVRVVSPRGTIERVVARVTAIVRAGEVFIPFHYDEACANRLTNDDTKLAVELRFNSLEDFEPEQVARQVEPLRKLLETRQQLQALLAKMDGNDKLTEKLQEIIGNTDMLKRIGSEVGTGETGKEGGNG